MTHVAAILLLQAPANPVISFLPFILILGIFYLLVFLPQRRQQKKHAEMVASLKRGDQVVTMGGLMGEITGVKDDSVQLRTGGSTVIVERDRIARRTGGEAE